MSRAISRESFNELKNYLGVYLQQGRAMLDSDWNENQDIAVSFMRRLSRESLGEGSPNQGFLVNPIFPPPPELLLSSVEPAEGEGGGDLGEIIGGIIGSCLALLLQILFHFIFGPLLFFLDFPGHKLEDFESLEGFSLLSPQGNLRLGRDRPYEGKSFLRVSGHAGDVTLVKTLPNIIDLSAYELVTFHYRLNHQSPGIFKFFVEDDNGNRSVWLNGNSALGEDIWLAGFASPLDISFHIITDNLPVGKKDDSYDATILSFGGTVPVAWTISAGALPADLILEPDSDDSRSGKIDGTPTEFGLFDFTVEITDDNGATATKDFTLEILESGDVPLVFPGASEFLSLLGKVEMPTGTPADLTQIRKYGFEVYQDAANPLVWDFDALRLGSSELEKEIGENNFIIRGSRFSQLISQLTLLSIFQNAELFGDEENGNGNGNGNGEDSNTELNFLDLLNTEFQIFDPSIENAGRMYVAGLPCILIEDTLYSEQSDPNDPPLTPPGPGEIRNDTVYLDVWQEAVTYVDDPDIREIALGGPDTSTRMRVNYKVRVNQGGDLPFGNGIGKGTLATEGNYTGKANRLYRVEIDTPGELGVATCRWSDDNSATIQRIIESVPPGSSKVVVEDASAFHSGDLILIRKEYGVEEHTVSTVFGNVITLQEQTGLQLATLPAASQITDFTTFALEDKPWIQRWNGFKIPINPDPEDETLSDAIDLNDGVQLRFGGNEFLKENYWNFKTRYLAGDETSGLDSETRIEQLNFQRARGVMHFYAQLALITRDGDTAEPEKIFQIVDKRHRVGNTSSVNATLPDVTGLTGEDSFHVAGMPLPPSELDSKHIVFWSGNLFIEGGAPIPNGARVTIQISFYNDEMVDLETDPDTGKIQDRTLDVALDRKPTEVEVPLNLIFSASDTSELEFLPVTSIPTSVQVFATLNDEGFSIELVDMQLTILELKKSF